MEKQSVYDFAIERIKKGERFYINLERRSLIVGKTFVITQGNVCKCCEGLGNNRIEALPDILHIIDELYASFRTSVPSETSDENCGRYFHGLSVDELTDEQLSHGESRHVARFRLEFFILCQLIYGTFVWDEQCLGGTWFYQSDQDKSLVIRRAALGL